MRGDDIERAQKALDAQRAQHVEKEARAAERRPGAATLGDAVSGMLPSSRELTGYAAILRDLTSRDPDARRRARFSLAEDVRRNLHRFKLRTVPSAPVRLPPESLLFAIMKKRGKARAPSDKATMILFSKWREAVYRAEHANESTMRALFDAVSTFRELELPDFAGPVLEHLEHEFEVESVSDDPREWSLARRAQRTDILSVDLRRNGRERRRKTVEHSDDEDDSALQGGFDIPEPGTKTDDFDPWGGVK